MTVRLDTGQDDFAERWSEFVVSGRARSGTLSDAVCGIIARIRDRGGQAVAEYTEKFDGLRIDSRTLRSDQVDLERLASECPVEVVQAIEVAARRIEAAHRRQRPSDCWYEEDGIGIGWRWTPVSAAGVYVPGGLASYPSSALMTAIPARVAGAGRVVMVAPAPKGQLSAALAVAALRAGVDEFYPIGGAQAIAALAYGAGDLEPVDMIAGPGNAWVTEAKRQVYGTVGIDALAGPSELCIVSDSGGDPVVLAADLLAQSEHDERAQSVLIVSDGRLADTVAEQVERQLRSLATQEVARASWEANGAIVVSPLERAAGLVDDLAPEHLHLALGDLDARAFSERVRHAGAVFMGYDSAEVFGDYVTGPSHVLPTSGTARFASGLATTDFMKRTSLQSVTGSGLGHVARAARVLARAEGLAAHEQSAALRMRTVR